MASGTDNEGKYREFKAAVNMTASAPERFLESEESPSVGHKTGGDGATGHQEGRRIVEILHKKKVDLSDDDHRHMSKVVGYVHRHLKQGGPKDDDNVADSPWRLSLMNWGHDPSKHSLTYRPLSGGRSGMQAAQLEWLRFEQRLARSVGRFV